MRIAAQQILQRDAKTMKQSGMALARLTVGLWLTAALCPAFAQEANQKAVGVGTACGELQRFVLNQSANAHMEEAERALLGALPSAVGAPDDLCAALIFNNLAAIMQVSGRVGEAEVFALQAINILERSYPSDDPALLRPLNILATARFEQGKTAKAREAFQRMQAIRTPQPLDRALVHGMGAALLQREGRRREAESEYLQALALYKDAGWENTVEAALILGEVALLFSEEHRFDEAQRALDNTLRMLNEAKGTVPMDRIKVFNFRAILHAREGQWQVAADDMGQAIALAEQETQRAPVTLLSILHNYAFILRKAHRKEEAKSVESRAAMLQRAHPAPDQIVDLTELSAETKRNGK
jgi:tetratricopeptide (TPR) repeat protein